MCWMPKVCIWTRCACRHSLSPDSVRNFLAEHDKVFVVEQNRDGQMHTMLVNELDINPARLVRVLHYDGTPITARFITNAIRRSVAPDAAKLPQHKELA